MMRKITPEYLASQGFSPTIVERFWAKVTKTESCWFWTASRVSGGRYGGFFLRYNPQTKRGIYIRAHIFSWILHFGEIPKGLHVLHNCPGGDNSLCIRPDHLWLGTHLQNMRDMRAKQRGRGHPPGEGHPLHKLTNEQVSAIRQLYSEVGQNGQQLADTFHVSRTTINQIVRKKTWISQL